MEFLRQYQMNIMFALVIVCGMLTLFSFITDYTSKGRKKSLILMSFSAMVLLISDRFAYYYHGNITLTGYYMVRICNYLVFAMTLLIIYGFNEYLIDFSINDQKLSAIPKGLEYSKIILIIGEIILIVSQFTGIYYTFDDNNNYQRGNGFVICYIFPLVALMFQLSVILKHRKNIRKRVLIPILLFTLLPLVASIIQIFAYGVSLTNITSVGLIVILYIFTIYDANTIIHKAHEKEITLLREKQETANLMLMQTSEALVSAIDAKDEYTNGHSLRVAEYSVMIAKRVGKTPEECEKIRIIGLLHDVGKIGVPGSVINKAGKLTDEEFDMIKHHPIIGNEILSKIQIAPELSIGAHYHHERYDGKGYPEGLKGDAIPEIARIIAVADTYDAMASKRSYRDVLPQEVVRDEIVKGIGTQFDPKFALVMLQLIDEDTEYTMRQM